MSNQADFFTFMLARKKGGGVGSYFFRVCPPNNLDSATSLLYINVMTVVKFHGESDEIQ